MLTVYRKQQSREVEEHFPIILLRNKYKIEGKADVFDNIESLLRHYTTNTISHKLHNIGHNYTFDEYIIVPNQEFQIEHDSYHDTITEEEAMMRLRQSDKPHCYLTYYSEEKQAYQLAVYKRQHPRAVQVHFPIIFQAGKYRIEGKNDKFNNVESLLNHYGAHRIHPSLANIGTNYTSKEYNDLPKHFQMPEHGSNHGALAEEEAMRRLRQSNKPHCYLTYFSQEKQKYVLAVYKKQCVEVHYPMILQAGKYKIEEKDDKFDDVLSLLNYYERQRIHPSLSNIGTNYTQEQYDHSQESVYNNMMEEHSSYHEELTEQEAMSRLKQSGQPHCYLTYFNKAGAKYMLAVYKKREPRDVEKHFPRDGKHKLMIELDDEARQTEEFDSIAKLLDHFEKERVEPSLFKVGTNYTTAYTERRKCVIL